MGIMIDLDAELKQRLDVLSAMTGRGMEDQIREAILRGLEDMEDLATAEAVSDRVRRGEEPTYTLEEVMRDLGLDDHIGSDGATQLKEDRPGFGEADQPLLKRARQG